MRKSPVHSTLACVVAALVAVGALAAAASSSVRHGSADTVNLVYWDDIYTDDASKKANMEMIAAFEKKNPYIKITWVAKAFGQFVPTARLALQGSGAPDIVICAAADTCNAAAPASAAQTAICRPSAKCIPSGKKSSTEGRQIAV